MDPFFVPKRDFIQLLCFWVWFCFAMLGSSLTESAITFDTEPSPQTVKAGSPVTLACSASYGERKISYEWEHNNKTLQTDSDSRLSMGPDGTLQISKAMFEDQGIYRCKASARRSRDRGSVSARSNSATLTVHCSLSVKPSGSIHLTGQDLQLRFKCLKSSDATYSWTKDGSRVVPSARITKSRNKLNINDAVLGDSGNYSCVATTSDNLTTPSSNILFKVIEGQSPQILVKPLASSIVVKGSQVVLNCNASGDPTPTIEWYAGADKSPMANSSGHTIFPNGSLVFDSVDTQHAIKYKCVASNLVGDVAAETELKIAYLKEVSTKRAKWYIAKNDKIDIECMASGLPIPTVTWKMAGGKDLTKRFSVRGCCFLHNNSTKLGDSGNYTCSASNKVATKTKTVQIIVSVPPEIVVKPKDQLLKENDAAVLNCSAHSVPTQKIIWQKDGKPFEGDKEHRISPQGNLVIPKAKPDDSGIYKCFVNHPGGWTDEAKANLTVMAAVKFRTPPFSNVNADLHKPLTMECQFVGHPPIKVEWKKNGADKFPHRIQPHGNVLIITSVEKEDAGQYICTGSNDFSSSQRSINVSVFMYPIFQLRPKNTTAYVDDSVWLHCNASGDPPPKISWGKETQGGDKLDPERFVIHRNGTLNIKNIQIEDEGRYYCIAANKADMRQITISLEVQATLPVPVKKTASMGRTIGIAVGCAAAYIVLVVGLMIYCKGRRARQNKKEEIAATEFAANGEIEHHEGEVHDMMLNPVHGNPGNYDKMEFPRHDLEALRTLGNGAYGRAFLARASGIRDGENETVVVVKALMSKDDMVREEFSKEMEALISIQHRNVVTLLGVCKEDPSYLIFESLEKGDLKQFLLSGYDNGRCTMTSNQKLSMCAQLATGMNYLASQCFVHKDLAARNCMVGRDLEIKIGFLSMSYDLYSAEYYRFNNIQIPLRWMSPEAIFDDEYTEKSDVWSYGVLVWEIYSLGQLPYHDRSDEEVLKCVKSDLRLPKPDNCPDTVLEILEKCWEGNPTSRPAFTELMGEVSGISVDSHV